MIKTCEFVTPAHPDKMCDRIADAILDAYLKQDPKSRVGLEVLGGHGVVTICGEVTSTGTVDCDPIVKRIAGSTIRFDSRISRQSPEIARGVDIGGAGDQGIMVGYATNETESLMPREYVLTRDLCQNVYKHYPYDGKTQVTLDGTRVTTVIASFLNAPTQALMALVRSLIEADEYLINPTGEWSIGGFDADSGITGRKLVIDAYGPQIPIGGGAFSGKDSTKVDRSAAYWCRHIACDLVRKGAREAIVKVAYAIGKADPVMTTAVIDGKAYRIRGYDFSPLHIIEALDLRKPQFEKTAESGHFGRGFAWD